MRKNRLIEQGAVYHVTARTNLQEFIFQTYSVKQMFLDILKRAKKKFSFKLKHFCIMSNHVHLLIEPTGTSKLSKIMQWILSVFAIKFNRSLGRKGHVWYDRFFSRIVRGKTDFANVFRYITRNPMGAIQFEDRVLADEFSGCACFRRADYSLVDPPDDSIEG